MANNELGSDSERFHHFDILKSVNELARFVGYAYGLIVIHCDASMLAGRVLTFFIQSQGSYRLGRRVWRIELEPITTHSLSLLFFIFYDFCK